MSNSRLNFAGRVGNYPAVLVIVSATLWITPECSPGLLHTKTTIGEMDRENAAGG